MYIIYLAWWKHIQHDQLTNKNANKTRIDRIIEKPIPR